MKTMSATLTKSNLKILLSVIERRLPLSLVEMMVLMSAVVLVPGLVVVVYFVWLLVVA